VLRLGLCCTFLDEDINFRTTTARYVMTLPPRARRPLLRELALHNAAAVGAAVRWCARNGVGAFRVQSGILPLATHPTAGVRLTPLDEDGAIRATLERARDAARAAGIRLSMHPDQFVVPGSPNPAAAASSVAELEHQAEVGQHLGVEQITIHGGGAQGGKPAALERLARGLDRLSPRARAPLVLENDDRVYTVEDLLPLCARGAIPLVYDVHHHRCNPDGLDVAAATRLAAATWGGREPWAHISSPAAGWKGGDPRPHADAIAPRDVPREWLALRGALTVDVEAKAKERAVVRLARWMRRVGAPLLGPSFPKHEPLLHDR
jgi:UV DNA damage endonuclease